MTSTIFDVSRTSPEIYRHGRGIAFDVETDLTGRLVAFSSMDTTKSYSRRAHFTDPDFGEQWERQRQDILEFDFLIAQQVKYELRYLDYPEQRPVWDTMLAHKCIFSNRPTRYDLDSIASYNHVAGKHQYVHKLIQAGVDTKNIPRNLLLEYNGQDVESTLEVFFRQREEIWKLGLEKEMYTMCLLAPILQVIEDKRGLHVDPERFRETFTRVSGEHRQVLDELAGILEGINPNSPDQLRQFIFDRLQFRPPTNWKGSPKLTGGGKLSVSKDVIAALAAITPEQQKFKGLKLRQAKLNADLTKLLKKLGEAVKDVAPIQFQFSQVIPDTCRLSSQGQRYKIQGQNINREYRGLFHLPDLSAEIDYSQLEFRVAGGLTGDPQIIADVEAKLDVHSITSNRLSGSGEKTNRQNAKSRTFRPLFGGTSGSRAERAYNDYFNSRYSVCAERQQQWVDSVAKDGYIILPTGMRMYWPELHYFRNGGIKEKSQIYNYPIQYFAARINQIATILLHQAGWLVYLLIHDSDLCSIKKEEIELFTASAVKLCGEGVYDYLYKLYGIEWKCPLGIDIKVGTHWGESSITTKKVDLI